MPGNPLDANKASPASEIGEKEEMNGIDTEVRKEVARKKYVKEVDWRKLRTANESKKRRKKVKQLLLTIFSIDLTLIHKRNKKDRLFIARHFFSFFMDLFILHRK